MALLDLTPAKYIVTKDKIECRRCGEKVNHKLPRNAKEKRDQQKAFLKLSWHDCDHHLEIKKRVDAELAKLNK